MKRTIAMLPLLAPLALAACGHSSDPPSPPAPPSPSEQLVQLEQEGKLPALDRSASVAGTDANGNGVRDDVDNWLAHRFTDTQQRAAATQMAKAVQEAVLVDSTSPAASKVVSQHLANAMNCLFARFPDNQGAQAPAAVGQEIEAVTTNTKPRLLAYLGYNKSRDGTALSLPKGDTCE
jgi:hypothetical protein